MEAFNEPAEAKKKEEDEEVDAVVVAVSATVGKAKKQADGEIDDEVEDGIIAEGFTFACDGLEGGLFGYPLWAGNKVAEGGDERGMGVGLGELEIKRHEGAVGDECCPGQGQGRIEPGPGVAVGMEAGKLIEVEGKVARGVWGG